MKSFLGHRRRTCAEDVCKEKRKVNLTFFALDFFKSVTLLLMQWHHEANSIEEEAGGFTLLKYDCKKQ